MSGLFSRSICLLAFFDSDPIAAAPPGLGSCVVGSINPTISHRGALVGERTRPRLAAPVRPAGISPHLDLPPLHPITPIIRLLNICPAVRLPVPIAPLFVLINLRDDRAPSSTAPRGRSLLEEPVPGPERAEHARAAHRAEHRPRPEHSGAEHPAAHEGLREEGVVEGVPAPAEEAGHRGGAPQAAESGEGVARAEGPVPPAPPALHLRGGLCRQERITAVRATLAEIEQESTARTCSARLISGGGGRRWLRGRREEEVGAGGRRSCLPGTAL